MGDPSASIALCGESLESACGTIGDDSVYPNPGPYDCKKCGTVTIYDGFPYSIQLATEEPTCQGVFTIPEDYGDVYYRNNRLYDAFGNCDIASFQYVIMNANSLSSDNQIGTTSCNGAVTWGGKFLNPWNHWLIESDPSPTPCPLYTPPPKPSVSCYYDADPDACPEQYEPGWCYCNNEEAKYPILSGDQPCGYTVMPTTTTTTPVCTATGGAYE